MIKHYLHLSVCALEGTTVKIQYLEVKTALLQVTLLLLSDALDCVAD